MQLMFDFWNISSCMRIYEKGIYNASLDFISSHIIQWTVKTHDRYGRTSLWNVRNFLKHIIFQMEFLLNLCSASDRVSLIVYNPLRIDDDNKYSGHLGCTLRIVKLLGAIMWYLKAANDGNSYIRQLKVLESV